MSNLLSPQLFAILSALVEERLGISYGPEDLELFGDKVGTRVTEAGFHSALDYYYFLRYDPAARAELDALADTLSVGETYFFRELDAVRAAVQHVVLPAIAKNGRARIWSAACATGEEPLSLAMVLEESNALRQCAIVATDMSARAITRAREGVYGPRALRALPPHAPPSGFTAALARIAGERLSMEEGRARVSRELVATIDYRQLNLLDEPAIAALGSFDLVLCRNVLIYFADTTVKRVVSSIASTMSTEGRLLVGTSESLLRFGTALSCEERGGAFFYVMGAK
jgi:chemotaxis protein methyltransferase CheR